MKEISIWATIIAPHTQLMADAIDSALNLADGFVYVYTGPSDQAQIHHESFLTMSKGKPTKIVDYPWSNDFAAARNVALQAARQAGADLALTLDDDERLQIPNVTLLREFLAKTCQDPSVAGAHLWADGQWYEKYRFLKPDSGRWEGRTHECFATGLSVWSTPYELGSFAELGKSSEAVLKKWTRDIEILRLETRNGSANGYKWYYLGESYLNAARWLTQDQLPSYQKAFEATTDQRPDLQSQRDHLFTSAQEAYLEAASKLYHSYERADALYRAALSSYYLDQLQRCAKLASEAFAAEPIHVESAYLCGFAFYRIGEYRQAHNWARAAALLGSTTQNISQIEMVKLPKIRRYGFVDTANAVDRAWDLYQWASLRDGASADQIQVVVDLWHKCQKLVASPNF